MSTPVTATESKAGWFEVIVGKSIPTDTAAKCFGFVTDYDTKPKRRLAELLKAQGLQMNQAITFLSDGGDNVRDLQLYLSPISEHLLDWFHVTMRITVLRQQLKELVARAATSDLGKLDEEFEGIKWYLWHGNAFRALQEIEGVQWVLEDCEDEVPASTKLAKSLREFRGYIEANEAFIPNYGERYRYGEAIATRALKSRGYGTQQSTVSLAGVFVVGVARDADNVADLLDGVVGVALEGKGSLALLLINTLGASAFATSGTRRRQTCIRPLADQIALKLSERREAVEDLPPAGGRRIQLLLQAPKADPVLV